jgi:catechol 2,3-dioxygenase-like lactoylglutathione lyase family enzyme
MALMKQCLDHVAIKVSNIKQSIAWYLENYKDAHEIYSDMSWGMIEIGDIKIAFVIDDTHPPHIGIRQHTCIPEYAKQHRDGSYYVYEKDPDGNVIEKIWWP